MSKTPAVRLADLAVAVQALPEDVQHLLVREIEERLSDISVPQMTGAQRLEVKRRMAQPRQYVSDVEVRAILRRYDPLP